MKREYTVGVDLGKRRDYTAIAVVERFQENGGFDSYRRCNITIWRHALLKLERVPLGSPYGVVVSRVRDVVRALVQRAPTTLVVDATGVGEPVVDALRVALTDTVHSLVAVTI